MEFDPVEAENGHRRTDIRVRWFGKPRNGKPPTYREMVLPGSAEVPDIAVDQRALAQKPACPHDASPVVFGHYWMAPTPATCLAPNATCVDYSVARKDGGGLLTAYRWSGETVLSDGNLVAFPTL